MSDKATAIHDLELGYQEFRGPIERLPEEAYSEVWLGTWSLQELLAHMAGWYREMTGAIERAGRGERPTPEGVDYGDSDAWNAKFAKLAKNGKAALKDFEDAYAGYLAAAKALPESMFGTDAERGRPLIGNRLLQGAGTGHFEEHQGQLDAWLKARKQ
jgi:hypothetical protein